MFVLRSKKDDKVYYLRQEVTTVGRQTGDIILKDNGVSRKHAELIVEDNKLYLISLKEQLRTTINNVPAMHKVRNNLNTGDIVKFGMSFEFGVDDLQFRVATSSISEEKATKLESYLKQIGARLLTSFKLDCTHLVVSELCPSVKVICAVILNIPMVTLDFFQELCDTSKDLPKETDYRPSIKRSIHEVKESYFQYNEKRKTLFDGKTFVFVDEKNGKAMKSMITLAGGEYSSFDPLLISEYTRTSVNAKYIIIYCDTLESLPLAKNVKTAYSEVCSALTTCQWRAVPMQEIAFALLKCNCDQDCNPMFNRGKNLLRMVESQDRGAPLAHSTQIMEQVLARNTETQVMALSNKETRDIIIPPSYENDLDDFDVNIPASSKSLNSRTSTRQNKVEVGQSNNKAETEQTIKHTKQIKNSGKMAIEQIDATINPFEEVRKPTLQINNSKRASENKNSTSSISGSNMHLQKRSATHQENASSKTDKKSLETSDCNSSILIVSSRKSGPRSDATLENPITKKAAMENDNILLNKNLSGQSESSQLWFSKSSGGDHLSQNKRKHEGDLSNHGDDDENDDYINLPIPIKIEPEEKSAKRQKSSIYSSFRTVKSDNLFETQEVSESDSKQELQTFSQTIASYFQSRIKYEDTTVENTSLVGIWTSCRQKTERIGTTEDEVQQEELMKEYAEKYLCNPEEKYKDLNISGQNSCGMVNYKNFRKTQHVPVTLKRTVMAGV